MIIGPCSGAARGIIGRDRIGVIIGRVSGTPTSVISYRKGTIMTTILTDVVVPTIADGTISMSYVIDAGERGRDTVTVTGTVADGTLLPARKVDALAFCTIYDACNAFVNQVKRGEYMIYNACMKQWNSEFSAASEAGNGKLLVRLLRDRPIKPDLSDEAAATIAPFIQILTTLAAAWSGAKKHTMSVFGTGQAKASVIWTGTLSSLTRKTPKIGVIAKGRRIR